MINFELSQPKRAWQWRGYVDGKNTHLIRLVNWRYDESGEREVWNIYLSLFEDHPLFERARNYNYPFGDAGWCPEMHGGVTHYEKSEKHVEFGCDYSHYRDDFYQQTHDPEQFLVDLKLLDAQVNGAEAMA